MELEAGIWLECKTSFLHPCFWCWVTLSKCFKQLPKNLHKNNIHLCLQHSLVTLNFPWISNTCLSEMRYKSSRQCNPITQGIMPVLSIAAERLNLKVPIHVSVIAYILEFGLVIRFKEPNKLLKTTLGFLKMYSYIEHRSIHPSLNVFILTILPWLVLWCPVYTSYLITHTFLLLRLPYTVSFSLYF